VGDGLGSGWSVGSPIAGPPPSLQPLAMSAIAHSSPIAGWGSIRLITSLLVGVSRFRAVTT
jgi:hypothetical protein